MGARSRAKRPGHWLVKSEPGAYSWSDFVAARVDCWDGVRNYTARQNLEAMRVGDLVLFYHSVKEKSVVGIARVHREAYPDPTAKAPDGPDWIAVDLEAVKALEQPVELAAIKADAKLADIALVRQSRLSVMPLPATAFRRILQLGKTRL